MNAESQNPSQHEANKMVRVLNGQKLKYTVRLHYADGRVLECQCSNVPDIKYNTEARCLWVYGGGYPSWPMVPWPDAGALMVEENPT